MRIVERTGSTNADLIADMAASEGDWLVALEQDAGRGRQGRSWTSERGNFFGSFGVETNAAGFCSTIPSCASHRYSDRTAASDRATEVLLNPFSYRWERKPRMVM